METTTAAVDRSIENTGPAVRLPRRDRLGMGVLDTESFQWA